MRMWCRPTSTPEAPRSKPRSLTMGPRAVLALCCRRFRDLPRLRHRNSPGDQRREVMGHASS